jgi:hypothetical protein
METDTSPFVTPASAAPAPARARPVNLANFARKHRKSFIKLKVLTINISYTKIINKLKNMPVILYKLNN